MFRNFILVIFLKKNELKKKTRLHVVHNFIRVESKRHHKSTGLNMRLVVTSRSVKTLWLTLTKSISMIYLSQVSILVTNINTNFGNKKSEYLKKYHNVS